MAEQLVGLKHKGDLVHELVRIHVANVYAAHEHTTRTNIPKTRDQACAGRLTAARGTNQRKGAACGNAKAHMIDGRRFGALVGKAHVLKAHIAANRVLGLGRHGELLGIHNASDARQRIGTHLRRLAHKHELGHGRRHHGRKDRVKRKVDHKVREVRLARCQQQRHGQKKCHEAIERGKVEHLRTSAKRTRIVLRHVGVFGDRIVERLKGVDRLLENLDHGDAAYVFGAGLVHLDQCAHVSLHKLGALAAHHGGHGAKRNDDRD